MHRLLFLTSRLTSPRILFPSSSPLFTRSFSTPNVKTKIIHPSNQIPLSSGGTPMFLIIDPSAVKQLRHLYSLDDNPNQALRVIVEAGGCHGFQYKLDLVDSTCLGEDDILFDSDGSKVVIDRPSLELVNGSRITFVDELIGKQFRLTDNPNADSSCGCGTSFEVKF